MDIGDAENSCKTEVLSEEAETWEGKVLRDKVIGVEWAGEGEVSGEDWVGVDIGWDSENAWESKLAKDETGDGSRMIIVCNGTGEIEEKEELEIGITISSKEVRGIERFSDSEDELEWEENLAKQEKETLCQQIWHALRYALVVLGSYPFVLAQ